MIEEWLKKNKPSRSFDEDEEISHVTPSSVLGKSLRNIGGKFGV